MFISLASILLLVFLVIKGKQKEALYFSISLVGGLIFQTIIKNILAVPRPGNSLVVYSGYSFPSGHTNMATILFLSLCFYVFQSVVNKRKRQLYYIASILIILFVGFSRLYLNAHWVSDVLAGWCLGIFWATLPLLWQNFVIFKHKLT